MSEPTCLQRDAASVIFNLPEYPVVAVVRDDQGRHEVLVETPVAEAGCPLVRGAQLPGAPTRTTQRVRESVSTGW